MMSLEPVIAPVLTPVTGEASQQGGSTITTAPTNEIWRPTAEWPISSAAVMIQSTSMQTPQLTVISISTTPPTVTTSVAYQSSHKHHRYTKWWENN
ncbi:unnamed protein product [Lactuca virosa]|uniref:Uncharacterized protein n=1 Tax=Lactuca virosa TaxID=75947 RepID=A0AAU9LFU2_9ASTR|nr:unnamed protein product [Lactuca virosa]